jgi:hypothetical protein
MTKLERAICVAYEQMERECESKMSTAIGRGMVRYLLTGSCDKESRKVIGLARVLRKRMKDMRPFNLLDDLDVMDAAADIYHDGQPSDEWNIVRGRLQFE